MALPSIEAYKYKLTFSNAFYIPKYINIYKSLKKVMLGFKLRWLDLLWNFSSQLNGRYFEFQAKKYLYNTMDDSKFY